MTENARIESARCAVIQMAENAGPPRLHDRVGGLRALQHAVDDSVSDGTALTAVFLDGGPVADAPWIPVGGNGNGTAPLPRLAAPLSRQVRTTDFIVLLGGETLLCALPGMAAADGRRRFDRVAERLGSGSIRVGVAGPAAGETALDLAASAEAAAPAAADGGTPMRLSLRLPAHVRAARQARVALRMFEDQLDADAFAVLVLMVTELVTNGVRHGSSSAADAVLIEVAMDGDALHGLVVDQGPGFEPATAESTGPGGLGLTIVERASKRWGTADGGRRVWFELERPAAPLAAG
jgi:anti-sigma regulatory factor (Ser/Thr protein kinase)